MELFHKILKTAVEGGASDIHIKADAPVVYRISSQLAKAEMTIEPPTDIITAGHESEIAVVLIQAANDLQQYSLNILA